uniref:Ras-related protein RABB1c-like n=1 Tax=Rhizophora mucronata TaxID=61149 RepID=A0A2P2KF39_RHIMU
MTSSEPFSLPLQIRLRSKIEDQMKFMLSLSNCPPREDGNIYYYLKNNYFLNNNIYFHLPLEGNSKEIT